MLCQEFVGIHIHVPWTWSLKIPGNKCDEANKCIMMESISPDVTALTMLSPDSKDDAQSTIHQPVQLCHFGLTLPLDDVLHILSCDSFVLVVFVSYMCSIGFIPHIGIRILIMFCKIIPNANPAHACWFYGCAVNIFRADNFIISFEVTDWLVKEAKDAKATPFTTTRIYTTLSHDDLICFVPVPPVCVCGEQLSSPWWRLHASQIHFLGCGPCGPGH